VNLRPLTAEDVDALAELSHACDETYLEWMPPGWTVPVAPPNWMDRYLTEHAWGLLASDEDVLVGSVAFRPLSSEVAHLGQLLVHPSRWREGIASRLLALAEDEMRARGYVRAQLWTPDGAPAQKFYVARGWRLDGRREWHPWAALEMVGYGKALT
jgi:GNAT superfamily N-acetyltransferase